MRTKFHLQTSMCEQKVCMIRYRGLRPRNHALDALEIQLKMKETASFTFIAIAWILVDKHC